MTKITKTTKAARPIYRWLLVTMVLLGLASTNARAHCVGTTAGTPLTNITGAFQSLSVPAGNITYNEFYAFAGATYTFSTCVADGGVNNGQDTWMDLTDAANTSITSADDICDGAAAKIVWTCSTSGVYRIHLSLYSGCGALPAGQVMRYMATGLPTPPTFFCMTSTNAGVMFNYTASFQQTALLNSGAAYFYATPLLAGAIYTWSNCTTEGGSGTDTYLRLYDAAGTLIAFADDICGASAKIVYTATTTGTYYIHLANYSCNALSSNERLGYMFVPPPSNPTISGISPSTNLCTGGGQTVTITGNNFTGTTAVTFNLVNAASFVVVNATTITAVTPAGLTAGIVRVTNPGGTGTSTAYTVSTNPTLAISPTSGTYCGTAIGLTASGASTYSWLPATGLSATTGTSVSSSPSATTTYTVTGTNAIGCTGTATSAITLGSIVTIGSVTATPNAVCSGGSSVLNATATYPTSANQVYLIPFGQLDNLPANCSPTVTYSSGNVGFHFTDVLPAGTVINSITAELAVGVECAGGVHTTTWNGVSQATFSTTGDCSCGPTLNGIKTVSISSANYSIGGLNSFLTNASTFGLMQSAAIGNSYARVTVNYTVTSAVPSSGFSWSGGSLSGAIGASQSVSGIVSTTNYTVTVTQGCSASGNVTITSGVALSCGAPTVTGATACQGIQTVNANPIGGGGPFTYAWTEDGISFGGNTASILSSTGTHTYAVGIVDNCGANCTSSGVSVTTVGSPTVSVSPTVATVCNGVGPVLTASGAATYTWLPATGLSATTGASVTATPAANTTYTVTGSNAAGCLSTASAVITAGGVTPTVSSVIATPASVCSGGNSVLAASASAVLPSPASGYSFTQSTTTYSPLSGATIVSQSPSYDDDSNFGPFNIGFTFSYHGASFTTIGLSDNCYAMLGGATSTNYNPLTGLSNAIAVMGADMLGNSATHQLRYLTTGTAGNQIFTAEWFHWGKYSSGTDEFSVQLQLFEATGQISIVYQPVTPASSFTGEVGITGASVADFNNRTTGSDWSATTAGGSNSATMSFSNAVFPANGLTFTWAPPTPTFTYAWSPSTFLSATTGSSVNATGVTSTTTYSVVASIGTCNSSPSSVTVTSGAALSCGALSVGGASACAGVQTVTASPIGGGGPFTYSWTEDGNAFGGNTISIFPSAGTHTYIASILDNCGANCTSNSVSVTTIGAPSASITSPNGATYCSGSGGLVAVTNGIAPTYQWTLGGSNISGATNFTYTPTGSGSYNVIVTATGCSATSAAQNISSLATGPAITSVTATPSTVCTGGNSVLAIATSIPAPVASYTFSQSTTTYTPLVGATVVSQSPTFDDDSNYGPFNLGFTFNYNGNPFKTIGLEDN